jgi:hypothetical protein
MYMACPFILVLAPVGAPHLIVEHAREEGDVEERGAQRELGTELQHQDLVFLDQLHVARSEISINDMARRDRDGGEVNGECGSMEHHYWKVSYLHLEMVNCIGTFLLASTTKNSDLKILI